MPKRKKLAQQVVIRRATMFDAVNVFRLLVDAEDAPPATRAWTPKPQRAFAFLASVLVGQGYAAVAVANGSEVVGVVVAAPIKHPATEETTLSLENFYVKQPYRGTSVTSSLLNKAVEHARGAGVELGGYLAERDYHSLGATVLERGMRLAVRKVYFITTREDDIDAESRDTGGPAERDDVGGELDDGAGEPDDSRPAGAHDGSRDADADAGEDWPAGDDEAGDSVHGDGTAD